MELVKIESHLNEFVKLRVGFKSVKDLDEFTLKKECASVIARAFTYSTPNGQTEVSILQHQTIELFNALKGKYATLTIPEVQRAFKMGLDNEFGQYYGMCGKTYSQFLKGFFEIPTRSKAWLTYLEGIEKPVIEEVSEDVKKIRAKQYLQKRFKGYKETGEIGFMAWSAYDLIKEFKGLQSLVSKEEFLNIFKSIEEHFTLEIKKEIKKAEIRKEDTDELRKFLKTGVINYKPCQEKVKEIALKNYFDKLITNNQTLDI